MDYLEFVFFPVLGLCIAAIVFIVSCDCWLPHSLAEFPMAMLGILFITHCGLWIVVIVSLCVCGCWSTLVLGCSRVVLATVGPRTTLCCLVGWSCVHRLFGIIPGHLCFFTGLRRVVLLLVCSGCPSDCAGLADLLMAW